MQPCGRRAPVAATLLAVLVLASCGGGEEPGAPPPEWVPSYPGAEPGTYASSATRHGVRGTFSLTVRAPAPDVTRFYVEALEREGFETTLTPFGEKRLGNGVIVAETPDERRGMTVMVFSGGPRSRVVISYVGESRARNAGGGT